MTFSQYVYAAVMCSNIHEAKRLIKLAADDQTISDQQYEKIRRVAIDSVYGFGK